MSSIDKLKKLSVRFLFDKNIRLTPEFYSIDFQKISNIFTYLKSVYLVFFQKLDMMLFYEFIRYVLHEFYGYKFVNYKYVQNQKPQIPDCLKFESNEFEIYLLIQQKPDGKLSIRHEFFLKINTFHQGYRIIKLLTTGSYGKVYLCEDEHGNQFAMKLFQEVEEKNTEFKALSQLEHVDGIIKPIDNLDFNLLGVPFGAFTMPYMEYTLKSYIEKNDPSVDFMINLFYELLIILRDSHANGVIHMDFKAENLLISVKPDGSFEYIRLADFGLAEILPEGTHYAKTIHEKITSWFRCPNNSLSKANDEMFHNSWIADLYAWCVSILYMMSLRISPKTSPYAPPSGKQFDFVNSYLFEIFRTQGYLTPHDPSDENPKEIDIKHSTDEINQACQTIKNPFLRNLLIEYMNPKKILRWYYELEISPKNNSIIPEVIAKMETYFRIIKVVAELNARVKRTESDTETPPRPHTTESH